MFIDAIADDENNPRIQKQSVEQDSNEKLKTMEKITELKMENSVISESNKRLLKEKDELTAFVDSIKNKLKEFSSNLPIPTAEEGILGGARDDGVITQLTNLINQNQDLKQNVRDLTQLVQGLEKDKLKYSNEIAKLNDERAANKKEIDEVNHKYKELNFKNSNEVLRSSGLNILLTSTTEKNISLRKTNEMLESRRDSLKLVLVTTKKNVEKLNEDETIDIGIKMEEESLQNLKGNSCEDILAEIDKGLTEHRTSCNLQKQKLRNAENELWCLRESNNMLKNEISRMEEEHEENEDEYEDEYDPTIENLERSNSDLINQLNNFANLCAQKDAEIKDLRTRLKNFKRRKYFRRFQPHWTN